MIAIATLAFTWKSSSFLVKACMYMITHWCLLVIPLPCTGWLQNNPNFLFIFIVGYTYSLRLFFVKSFYSILLQWVYHYMAFEKEEFKLLMLLRLRHFRGSLCFSILIMSSTNAPTSLSFFVNLTSTKKIIQWETSSTEKLKTLFLMLLNSLSLFQLKCILTCNTRKEHSPMLRKSSDQQ